MLAAVLGGLVVIAALALTGNFDDEPITVVAPPAPTVPPTIVQAPTTESIPGTANDDVAVVVAQKVVPSIVTVDVGSVDDGALVATGSGSGVVLDHEGHVITNHHVVADAAAASVVLHDGRSYEADIIGSDALTDLAVLKIEATDLTPIDIGEATTLVIGETAIAVGNPLGQEGGASLTVGVISALDRIVAFGTSDILYGMLQTDAPINSGSSGGALVDGEGALIGITSAIGVSNAGAEGIGYAIPVELAQRVTDEIIETGLVRHSFLGIEGGNHFTETADGAIAPAGAVINSLLGGESAAAAAGLEDGDVIVRVGESSVTSMQDLVVALRLYRVGEEVEVEVIRDGAAVSRTVTLIERPENP
jgi:S1-C subfamily serine protease